MIRSIGRTVVLVHDYDEALAFYGGVLGFEPIVDIDVGGGMRYVHIRVPGQEDTGLWLMEAMTELDKELVGRQASGHPFFVFYTDDAEAAFRNLEEKDVEIVRPIVENDGAAFFHFADLYGNEIVMVQLKAEGSTV